MVTQKEMGGKDVLLKAGISASAATTNASATITSTAHGLKVGDIVKFETVGALVAVNVNTFYWVKTILTANTFEISATKSGAAISMDATEAALSVILYKGVGGIRSKSLAFSSEAVDITNEDSDEWKSILDKAGVRSLEVSGSGVYSNYEVAAAVRTKALANDLVEMMIIEKSGFIFAGPFKLASFEISGEYDAESNLSISASSAAAVSTATISA